MTDRVRKDRLSSLRVELPGERVLSDWNSMVDVLSGWLSYDRVVIDPDYKCKSPVRVFKGYYGSVLSFDELIDLLEKFRNELMKSEEGRGVLYGRDSGWYLEFKYYRHFPGYGTIEDDYFHICLYSPKLHIDDPFCVDFYDRYNFYECVRFYPFVEEEEGYTEEVENVEEE